MILPLVSELLSRVGRQPAVDKAIESLRYGAGVSRLAGLTDPAKAIVTALTAARLPRPVVLVVESNERAESCLETVRYFYRAITSKPDRRVVVLPAYDVLPYEGRSPHPQISEVRGAALWRFASGEADILIAPIAAAQMRLFDASFYGNLARVIERDQDIAHSELLGYLHSVGYETHETVEMPGQLTVRGGIVDLFSPEALRPVRLEFFGDSLESIREFDADTQRSTRALERTTILPLTDTPRQLDWLAQLAASEETEDSERQDRDSVPAFYPGWEFHRKIFGARRSSLLDLRPEALMIEDEPETLREADAQNRARLTEEFKDLRDDDEATAAPDHYFLNGEEWDILRELYARLEIEHLAMEREGQPSSSLLTQPTARFHGNVSAFMAEVRTRLQSGDNVIASASTIGEIERFADICHEYEVPYRLGEFEDSPTGSRLAADSTAGGVPALVLLKAPLDEGVAIPNAKLTLFGNADLFETLTAAPRSRSRPKTASFFTDISDLRPGDHVVHVDHGIGRFDGLRQIAVDGTNGEFMLLTYADEAKIYLPLARLDLVQKYQSLGGPPPVLDRLGSAIWEARKARVRKSVDDMAEKLLALYADRKAAGGHAFPPDSDWQREFEDAFEFEETPDQAKAIADVKRDLESDLPMDRLLCGDVGYGKTEVAMRAAFKALADGKQVAMLAPTTVLAFQHYQTFRSRFAAFPMRIDMLSRFRSNAEQQKTIEALAAGQVDVIIGTHRLLSKDVVFHDLGLLVVDEEQRFGVSHKERLKEIRKNVDVLTMSATPIPRTLHMSLVGLRDMSVIETPPKDRIAIQTSVAPFQEGLIQRAIEAELGRQGQVFFVHNRVESIVSLAALINKLVPKARVVIGHGQMKEAELEKVMMKFIRHEADVLVSTTIIENGLDIPRANTILINRADRMGLAELYQLRGRVGRSDLRAYAYLLVPPEGNLTTIAKQRLAALKEFSELGAGFRIAALDLELRGAGNILGRQQHGHIEAVGFDLYCRMMERSVAERKGEAVRPERRTTLNLGQDVRIPKEYIESENLRLRIYKRIADITKDSDYEEVRKELEDRFGPLPSSVGNLLDYALLKAAAERLLVASIDRRGDQLAIKFHEDTPVRPEKLVGVIRQRPRLRLDPSGVLWVSWKGEAAGVAIAARNVLLDLEA
jgi:transcription-repair coupling factor (superfamily II helicase)